jgi:hypothetical protein
MTTALEQLVGHVPDGVVPLIGYREWALWRDGRGPTQLRSLFHPTVWPHDRALGAVCLRPLIWHGRTGIGHESVPDALCECGIYAFREPEFDTLRGAKGPKARGVVQGWGRYVLGTAGWRCEYARVVALLEDEEDPATSRDIGRRYTVPVIRSLERSLERLRSAALPL